MKKLRILLAASYTLFLFSGQVTMAQDAGLNFPPYGASRQEKLDFFNNEIKKCNDHLDEISIGINKAEILLEHEIGKNTIYGFGVSLYRDQLRVLQYKNRVVCNLIEYYQKEIKELPPPTPTPTPTLTPVPTSSTPGNDSKSKSDEEYETEMKFIKDYRAKLDEIKIGTVKISKEIDEYTKKATPYRPADGFTAMSTISGGVSTTTFTTPEGRITVYLPEDMQAGDTITGTVSIDPNGKTEEERKKNGTTLGEYGIDVVTPEPPTGQIFLKGVTTVTPASTGANPKPGPPRWTWTPLGKQPWLTFNVPKALTKNPALVLTKNNPNTTIPTVLIQQAPIPIASVVTPVPPVGTRFPLIGQTGRPIEIKGVFDGDVGTTKVNVGGKPAEILVESPRKCIFRSPTDVIGPTEITVDENGKVSRGPFRNIGLRLSAPKLNLMRGEKTTLTVEILGVEGLRTGLPLELEKKGTVTMEGGDYQVMIWRPNGEDAWVPIKREITGVQPGGFNVTATVHDPSRSPVEIPVTNGARVNGFRVVGSGDKARLEFENVIDPRTGKPVEGAGKLKGMCEQPILGNLPYVELLFKRGNAKFEKNECVVFIAPRIVIE